MEGVTFTLAQILEIQESMGVKVDVVRLGGGGAKSAVWKQMQADVFGKPAVLTNTEEGPAYGAALVGGVVAGAGGSVEEACRVCVREVERIEPRGGGEYGRARKVFGHLYDDLRAAMHELSGD
jgi:xylulokinase